MTLRVAVSSACCLALLLSACNGDPDPTASTPPTSSASITPTDSATPTRTPSADPKKIAADAAIAAYRRWDAGIYAMEKSGGKDVSMLTRISIGTQLNLDRARAGQVRAEGIHAIHPPTIAWARPSKYSASAASGAVTGVTVTACVDVTKADAVDARGKSVVTKDRAPRQVDTADVRLSGSTWKVALLTNKAVKSC